MRQKEGKGKDQSYDAKENGKELNALHTNTRLYKHDKSMKRWLNFIKCESYNISINLCKYK